MTSAIACLAAAFVIAAAILVSVHIMITRRDRADARAAIGQTQDEAGLQAVREAGWRAFDEYGDEPVPYWPPEAAEALTEHALLLTVLCNPCNDGTGECLCTIQCGQLPCMGGFSDEDVAFLKSLTWKGTDQ